MYFFDQLSSLVFCTDKKTSSQSLSLPLGFGTSDSQVARADGGKAVGKTCSCLRKPIAFENKAYAIGDASRCNVPCVISNIASRLYPSQLLGGVAQARRGMQMSNSSQPEQNRRDRLWLLPLLLVVALVVLLLYWFLLTHWVIPGD